MKIESNSDVFNHDFKLISLATVKELPVRIKQDSTGSTGKTVPNLFNGKPTYRTGLKVIKLKDGVPAGEDFTLTISTLNQPENGLKLGEFYRAAGKVWFTPYISNGRIHFSVIVEKIEPALTLGVVKNGL